MIRILTADELTHREIIIDGKLSGECVELVERFCNEAIGNGRPVQLYLRDVSTIDESGRALLGRLSAKGISLKAAGRVPGGSRHDSKRQPE